MLATTRNHTCAYISYNSYNHNRKSTFTFWGQQPFNLRKVDTCKSRCHFFYLRCFHFVFSMYHQRIINELPTGRKWIWTSLKFVNFSFTKMNAMPEFSCDMSLLCKIGRCLFPPRILFSSSTFFQISRWHIHCTSQSVSELDTTFLTWKKIKTVFEFTKKKYHRVLYTFLCLVLKKCWCQIFNFNTQSRVHHSISHQLPS